jgi:hypothetical protein
MNKERDMKSYTLGVYDEVMRTTAALFNPGEVVELRGFQGSQPYACQSSATRGIRAD